MKDFNLNTNTGTVTLTDEMALIIQQIDIIFDTQEKSVFGEPSFGANFYNYLHDMTVTNEEIRAYVQSLLSQVHMFDYTYDVTVDLLKGTVNDIILVGITIKDGLNSYKKTYKVE